MTAQLYKTVLVVQNVLYDSERSVPDAMVQRQMRRLVFLKDT